MSLSYDLAIFLPISSTPLIPSITSSKATAILAAMDLNALSKWPATSTCSSSIFLPLFNSSLSAITIILDYLL